MRPDGMYDRTPCTSNIVISLFIELRITVSFLYTPTMRSKAMECDRCNTYGSICNEERTRWNTDEYVTL